MISLRARRVACLIWMMAGRYDLHRVPLAALVTALLRVPYAHRGARPRQVVVAAAAQSIWSTFTLTYLDRSTAAPRLGCTADPIPAFSLLEILWIVHNSLPQRVTRTLED